MNVKEIAIEEIDLSVRAKKALQGKGVITVGQMLEYTEEKLYRIRNLGAKSVTEILKKIEECRSYAETNEIPPSLFPKEDKSDQEDIDPSAVLAGRNVNNIAIDEIGLSPRAVHALHFNGVDVLGQLLEYTEEKLLHVRNLGEKTIAEILNKIESYRLLTESQVLPQTSAELFSMAEGRAFIEAHLQEKKVGIEVLDILPARAYNLLTLRGYTMLHQILFMDEKALLMIPWMDPVSASEIRLLCDTYLQENGDALLQTFILEQTKVTIFDMISMPEYHDTLLAYFTENDRCIDELGLSSRPVSQLTRSGYQRLSQIMFLKKADLLGFQGLGSNSVDEILEFQRNYLAANEQRLIAYCSGDKSVLLDDETIRDRILDIYSMIGFGGLSLSEMTKQLNLPDSVPLERIKHIIGSLLAAKELEYVDYRCYRVYPRFSDVVRVCTKIDDRSRRILQRRLDDETLENIRLNEGNLSRERVRQIIKKGVREVKNWYVQKTKLTLFDEDYYHHLYSTYSFDQDSASSWLGIPGSVFCYLDMQGVTRGERPINEALSDPEIDAGLRLKIKNYVNRDRLFINGVWVKKKRADLEEVVARQFCQFPVSYEEYAELYNDYLRKLEIPYDDKLYYTPDVIQSRKNHLTGSRFILWTQGEKLRYYDIDGQDYSEFFDTLELDGYEDIEISALKLMDLHPEIMEKYGIRNHYELHNLMKKIITPEMYPHMIIGRMPMLAFGCADRSAQLLDLIIEHAPCTYDELLQYARDEYGYDVGAVSWNTIVDYYHDGIFSIDQKVMHYGRREILQAHLADDFYYLDEIRNLYLKLFPDGDIDEVNHYNLRQMGFVVRSKYAVQHYSSLDAYFSHLLTEDDLVDISQIRKRFACMQSFSQTLSTLKRERQIFEYDPNQLINIRRLERNGVTKDSIQAFCDAVCDFVPDGTYFSACSLRKDGFDSELFDLGFSDWFYGSVLCADSRFSFTTVFGSIILYKGKTYVSTKAFESSLICQAEQIDAYDLQAEMTDHYGCYIKDKSDLAYKVQSTEIYYDRILDRFYANEDAFQRDLDKAEGI